VTMKRVIAYTMHETETALAMKHLANHAWAPGYIMGDADDLAIKRLRRKGLALEIIGNATDGRSPVLVEWPQEMRASTPVRTPALIRGVRRASAKGSDARAGDTTAVRPVNTDPGRAAESADYEVSVAGPLVRPWHDALLGAGAARIGERLVSSGRGQPTYLMRLTPTAATKVAALEFVTGVSAYEPPVPMPMPSPRVEPLPTPVAPRSAARDILIKGNRRPRTTGVTKANQDRVTKGASTESSAAPGATALTLYEVLLPDQTLRVGALKAIAAAGITVRNESERKVRVAVPPSHAILARLTREFRAQVSLYVKPRKHLDAAGELVGICHAGTRVFPFQGRGQVIGIADTGIDHMHPDLMNRILTKVGLGRIGQTDDPDGHGTHVAGIAVGTGAASRKKFQGAAPKAKLYFQSLLDAQGELGGLPFELSDLFQPAYNAGVRIHNNSWGTLHARATRSARTKLTSLWPHIRTC